MILKEKSSSGFQERCCGLTLPLQTKIHLLLPTITSMLLKSMVIQIIAHDYIANSHEFCCASLPRIVRGDRGTENSRVAYLQPFLGRDSTPVASFQYGKSVSNQV